MRRLYLLLVIIGIILGTASCSWFSFGDDPVEDDETYREGLQALEEKNFDLAISRLREVPPDSPHYAKTLELIQQIPLQRAEDAIANREYAMAMTELEKIPETHEYYPMAQQLKSEVMFHIALDEYQTANGASERIRGLANLAEIVAAGNNKESLIGTIEVIGGELNQSNQMRDIENLITLLQTTLEDQQDPDVIFAGLEQSFEAYSQFNSDPRFRDQLLRLIASLKLKL